MATECKSGSGVSASEFLGQAAGLHFRPVGVSLFAFVEQPVGEAVLSGGSAGLGADAPEQGRADQAVLVLAEQILQTLVALDVASRLLGSEHARCGFVGVASPF